MVRGFYTLGSGLLTQNRKLTGISNNLANVNTAGYKRKEVSSTTFGNMVISRVDSQTTPIGTLSLKTLADRTNIIHSQGTLKNTGRSLDFAIKGEGFFAVQGTNGTEYTRDGSFNVDQQGYLALDGKRVLGANGPIRVGTDQLSADSLGNLYVGGSAVGRLAVYNFNDYNALTLNADGMFSAAGGAPALAQSPNLGWKMLEGSNVDPAKEMTDALAAQRELQGCSQAIKMYDQVLARAVTEIGKI